MKRRNLKNEIHEVVKLAFLLFDDLSQSLVQLVLLLYELSEKNSKKNKKLNKKLFFKKEFLKIFIEKLDKKLINIVSVEKIIKRIWENTKKNEIL